MTQDQDTIVAAATVADEGGELWRELLGKVAGCFPRRETRQSAAEMAGGLLMELEDYNCWTIAGALGHCGPHRLQHCCPGRPGMTGRFCSGRRRGRLNAWTTARRS